jgi:hypothetical protein
VCISTSGPWVADPHSTSRDNDQGCGHSDAATCFPIQQRHGSPLCRAGLGHAVYRLLIFPFSLRGAVLQQRQNRTERSKQVQTRRKIIIDGHSAAQIIPDRDDVDDWPGLWLIEELGSRVCDLPGPPPIRLPPAARYETSSEYKHLHKYFFGAHAIFISAPQCTLVFLIEKIVH